MINVLIPLNGEGVRFREAGYIVPKPLIDINGQTMLEIALSAFEDVCDDVHFIFVVRQEHLELLKPILLRYRPHVSIILATGHTKGAAITTLLAKPLINTSSNLIIANTDQYVEWDATYFIELINNSDGAIALFEPTTDPKWSFAQVDKGYITCVAEKTVLPDSYPTCGIYGWKKGSYYVQSAERMIQNGIMVNNEFYVCPVYNEAIDTGGLFYPLFVNKMIGLGTPEDLNTYIESIA